MDGRDDRSIIEEFSSQYGVGGGNAPMGSDLFGDNEPVYLKTLEDIDNLEERQQKSLEKLIDAE